MFAMFVSPTASLSREQSPRLLRLLHAPDTEAQSRQAHRDFLLATQVERLRESAFEDAEEFVHHFGFRPKKALQVLHPLEIGNHHATRVAKNVGNDENVPPLFQ